MQAFFASLRTGKGCKESHSMISHFTLRTLWCFLNIFKLLLGKGKVKARLLIVAIVLCNLRKITCRGRTCELSTAPLLILSTKEQWLFSFDSSKYLQFVHRLVVSHMTDMSGQITCVTNLWFENLSSTYQKGKLLCVTSSCIFLFCFICKASLFISQSLFWLHSAFVDMMDRMIFCPIATTAVLECQRGNIEDIWD